MADLGGVRGCTCTPLWQLLMHFCVNNCTSPSNDYTAVECSNNNQAQLHTHVSVPYWPPDDWLGLELFRDIQFGRLRDQKWAWQPPKFSPALRAPVAEPPFLNFWIRHWHWYKCMLEYLSVCAYTVLRGMQCTVEVTVSVMLVQCALWGKPEWAT